MIQPEKKGKTGAIAILFALTTILITGCAGIPFGGCGHLQGMMYDSENRPVCGYELTIDGKKSAITDINGRFDFPSVKFGKHGIIGRREGFSKVKQDYDFADRSQILYLRVPSIDSLYCKIDSDIMTSTLEGARQTLAILAETEADTRRYALYHGIYRFWIAEASERKIIAEEIEALSRELEP